MPWTTHHQQADQLAIKEKGNSPHEHRATFETGVSAIMSEEGKPQRGERDGRSGREEAGKAFRLKHIPQESEEGDSRSPEQKSKAKISPHNRFIPS